MLGDSYLKINNVAVPNPVSFKKSFDNVETVTTSEAGTDLTAITRLKKLSLDMTFNCSSFWADKLSAMCEASTSTLTCNGVSKTGRLRLESSELVENSERVINTDGLWVVSVTFSEV